MFILNSQADIMESLNDCIHDNQNCMDVGYTTLHKYSSSKNYVYSLNSNPEFRNLLAEMTIIKAVL